MGLAGRVGVTSVPGFSLQLQPFCLEKGSDWDELQLIHSFSACLPGVSSPGPCTGMQLRLVWVLCGPPSSLTQQGTLEKSFLTSVFSPSGFILPGT